MIKHSSNLSKPYLREKKERNTDDFAHAHLDFLLTKLRFVGTHFSESSKRSVPQRLKVWRDWSKNLNLLQNRNQNRFRNRLYSSKN